MHGESFPGCNPILQLYNGAWLSSNNTFSISPSLQMTSVYVIINCL